MQNPILREVLFRNFVPVTVWSSSAEFYDSKSSIFTVAPVTVWFSSAELYDSKS